MGFSETVFVTPLASLLFVGALSSGACSSSNSTLPTPPEVSPPPGLTFVGGEFGGPCTEDTYTGAGTGYAFCDDGKWAYTTTDPATDGYNEVTPSADASFDTAPAGDAGHDGSDLRDGPERDGEDQGDGQQR